jgi:hypothetical protein
MIRIFVRSCATKNGGRRCGLSSISTKHQQSRAATTINVAKIDRADKGRKLRAELRRAKHLEQRKSGS